MNKLLLIFTILILALNSCRKIEPKSVLVLKADYFGERIDTLHFSLLQYDSLNFKVFHYTDSTTELGLLIRERLIIDTKKPYYIIVNHDTININGSKVFSSCNKRFLVKRYIAHFIKDGPDIGFYVNDTIGILFIQAFNEGNKFSFISDPITQSISNQISNDTTGYILNINYTEKFLKIKSEITTNASSRYMQCWRKIK